jgi:hypothetical protein
VSTIHTNGPLATALLCAVAAAKLAEQAWQEDDSADADDETAPTYLASLAADKAVVAARNILMHSDEEIEWDVSEEGNDYRTVWASSSAEALEIATADYDASCYGDVEETFRITIRVTNDLIDETDTDTITIDPTEPDCADEREHDWRSPYSVVGGVKENPGVWGSDHGSVRCTSVCSHCGTYRTVDYGGTDRSNGTQITTASYALADVESLAWVAEQMADRPNESEAQS